MALFKSIVLYCISLYFIVYCNLGLGMGAQISSRLSVVFLVIGENAGKTTDIPKHVDQVPSGSEHSKSL